MRVTENRPARLGLTGHDWRKLRAAVRAAADPRHVRRLQAVLLLAAGQPLSLICAATGFSRQTVYNALRRYRRRRATADLADAPRSGRPPVTRAVGAAEIRAALRLDPRAAGYNATTWTVGLLARHLSARHGCPVTARTLRRRMRSAGLRWKRPRHVFHLRDPHAAQKKGASAGG
jgi:transposase